ncbi:MAG: chemotaxis protein CheW [Methylovirgula sp.]
MADTAAQASGEEIIRAMLFWLGDQCCAIAADLVDRVVASPPLSRLPLLPDGISGVVALAGKVVPVIDLRKMLGLPENLPEKESGDGDLVLVTIGGAGYALRVDRVGHIAAGIQPDVSLSQGAPVQYIELAAVLEQCVAESAAMRPALMVGLRRDAAPAGAGAVTPHRAPGGAETGAMPATALAVETAAAHALLPLDAVIELSDALPLVAIPDPEGLFAGGAFYGDALLPVTALDKLLGRPSSEASAQSAFVIVEVAGRRCVLAVKRVIGLTSGAAACEVVDLRSLLTNLLPRSELPRASESDPGSAKQAAAAATRYLLVELAGRTCAFTLISVAHIHPCSPVIQAPVVAGCCIAGVTAIGGRVLPVLDLAGLLRLPAHSAMTHFVELKSQEFGSFVVAVDAIHGIVPIAPDALLRPPEGSVISAVVQRGATLVWVLTASLIAEGGGRRSDAA